MDYTVYSYGGAEMLWKVLNSVAMMAGSTYFTKLSTLIIGVGLLTVAARSIPAASLSFMFKKWVVPTFLLMGFFWGPKVTVNLVDHVDTNFKAAEVANVPLGMAFAASLSTRMSHALTEMVEKFVTSSDMERFSQVGPMFAARLMYEARTLTIKDSIMRENLKDFTRQCFAWPYVFTNIFPGKKAALESQDMLGFIETNAHKALGMYWRNPKGDTEFLFCGKCAAKVKEVLPLEIETGFKALAGRLFGTTEDSLSETKRLKQYFGDSWAYLAKGSSDAAQVVQQELMLNAYRAALQDKREEFGLSRNSALTYLNAERGQIQQDESFLVKAALAGTQIPSLHTLLFCIALLFFAIVAPFTFVNGGHHMVLTFAKVMLWLASWPPLFAILNALGHMYLAKASSGQLLGYGEGLSLMTQNGLADIAYHTYTFIMGLQYSVPFVSWALLSSGGGYALSQFSTFLTQSGESFASKAASEMVDGNVSFDSQTLHHRSVANTQLAQQQLSPNINYGSRFDDGKLATLYGPRQEGGIDHRVTFQEHLTQLGTSIAKNDGLSTVMALGSAMSYSAGLSHTKQSGEQAQLGMQKMFSLMEKIGNNESFTETFGDTESANANKALNNVISQVKQFATDNKISEASAFSAYVGAGLGLKGSSLVKGGGLFGTILGGLSANAGFDHKTSGSKMDDFSKRISADQSRNFNENLGTALSFMSDNKASISEGTYHDEMGQIQDSFNKSKFHSEQAAASFQQQKTFNESASISRQTGISSTSNLNDDLIKKVANERYGGDVSQAAREFIKNPDLARTVASQNITDSRSGMLPSSLGSKETIEQDYDVYSQSIEPAPTEKIVEQKMADLKQAQEEITAKVQSQKVSVDCQQTLIEDEADKKAELQKHYEEQGGKFNAENEKSTPGIVGKRIFGE